jgi:hypothetical protein
VSNTEIQAADRLRRVTKSDDIVATHNLPTVVPYVETRWLIDPDYEHHVLNITVRIDNKPTRIVELIGGIDRLDNDEDLL